MKINRQTFALLTAAFLLTINAAAVSRSDERPNVVVILADDK